MQRGIRLFGDEVLRRKAAEVPGFTPDIETLVCDMFESMYRHEGLGLAAPQVGESLRVAVIDVPREGSGRIILINPVILREEERESMEEGCLSFPGIVIPVERARVITVEFTTPAGARKTKTLTGITAQAVQHELDHLEGRLIVDSMSVARRALLAARLRGLRKLGERGETR